MSKNRPGIRPSHNGSATQRRPLAKRAQRKRAPWIAGLCAIALLVALVIPFAFASSAAAPQIDGALPGQTASIAQDQAPATNDDQHGNGNGNGAEGDSSQPARAAADRTNSQASEEITRTEDSALPYQPDTVIVRLNDQANPDELTQTLAEHASVKNAAISTEDIANGFAAIELAEGYDVQSALDELVDVAGIAGAQPNFTYQLQDYLTAADVTKAATINDPKATSQWALDSIYAYDAWGLAKTDHNVTVAIVDSGCRLDHKDLKDNIVASYDATGKNDVSDYDSSGHGTHVAGIIAARANNSVGVAGVSYNAGIIPIRVLDDEGVATTETIVRAYRYIMNHASEYNIKVVNMSLGATVLDEYIEVLQEGTDDEGDDEEGDDLLIASIQQAYDADILTVCSSGNDAGNTVSLSDGTRYRVEGAYHNYPSDYLDCIVGVIALQNGTPATKASYSNFNIAGESTKDISAPGTNIISTLKHSSTSYGYKNGTSMASPCVAGIAALVFAANPDLSAAEVSELLCDTATDLGDAGWDLTYGAGEVNAAAAVRRARGLNYVPGNGTIPGEGDENETPPDNPGSAGGNPNAGNPNDPGNSGSGSGVDPNEPGNSGSGSGVDPDDPGSSGSGSDTDSDKPSIDVPDNATTANTPNRVAKPRFAGASRMPIGSTCTWDLQNCTLKVLPESTRVLSVEGATVRAKAAGTGKLGIYNSAGAIVAIKSVKVTKVSGTVSIKSETNKKYQIDLKKSTKKSGVPFAIRKTSTKKRQDFKFKLQENGSYLIINKHSKKCVSVKASSKKSGARIVQRKKRNLKSQRWNIVVDAANRISFVNAKSGKVLSTKDTTAKSGGAIVQMPASENLAQKWSLVNN